MIESINVLRVIGAFAVGSLLIQPANLEIHAQTPDRPRQESLLLSLVDTLNSGDVAGIGTFVKNHLAPERVEAEIGYWHALHRELGPLEARGRLRAKGMPGSPYFDFFFAPATRAWVVLELDVNPDRAGQIDHRGVRRGVYPAGVPPEPRREDGEVAEHLGRYLEGSATGDHFSGVVVLARGGRVLLEQAFGWADREQGVANTPDTPFALASVSKLFAGVAIAQLEERGLLSYGHEFPVAGSRSRQLVHAAVGAGPREVDLVRAEGRPTGRAGGAEDTPGRHRVRVGA